MNMHINVIYYQAIVENYFTSRFIQSQSKWYTVHIIIVRATDVKVLIFHFLMVDTRITMVIKQTKKATRVTVSQLVTDKLNYIKLYQLHLYRGGNLTNNLNTSNCYTIVAMSILSTELK
jgi:hypothetical protein